VNALERYELEVARLYAEIKAILASLPHQPPYAPPKGSGHQEQTIPDQMELHWEENE
jgi:hypothetical protein